LADGFSAGILYDQLRLIVRTAFQNASKQPREFFIVIAPQDRLTSIVDDQPCGKIFDKREGRGVVQPSIHFALRKMMPSMKRKGEQRVPAMQLPLTMRCKWKAWCMP
jgi:hypothetical protein